jgi:hypothetical protein
MVNWLSGDPQSCGLNNVMPWLCARGRWPIQSATGGGRMEHNLFPKNEDST